MEELGRKSPEENLRSSKRPITVILDNIRSGLNVGSILRSADAFGIESMILCGITPYPPDRQVLKSALGAECSVKWKYAESAARILTELKKDHHILIVEQTTESMDPRDVELPNDMPLVLVFGNELKGVSDELLPLADKCIELPQAGYKHSLNVAVCAGILMWEMTRLSET